MFLDYAIHDQFKQEFNRKISIEGENFRLEVQHFRNIFASVFSFCSSNNSSKLIVNSSPWNKMFSVSSEDCVLMKTEEKTFIKALRQGLV